ncbi:adenylate/guanylate cyclase [[Leptolyngbya] sp. PCC 7376]|uniref:adenylate/guanylate cyclase domain-containing protein n=1 Tax=[Leptolyngbya] sp. PCC 7376 TaxID=111781 RepID=UPI00029F1DD9|nr:adenylate/guanylate cyclase domain-containing protein [[Leptolyngbya] sp. PCC 7376]AFY40079.1 adenylate/guanylate cyclase [[Leptolyngbya] sp. PCC 7376]
MKKNQNNAEQNVCGLELSQKYQELEQEIENLGLENSDLEMLIETITEHADFIESELEKRNKLIRQIFGRYLTDKVVDKLLETPEGLRLGGKRQKLTVLTSDLRSFTPLSESLDAEIVIKIINTYLSEMIEIIDKYGGNINNFLGDGILVLFGVPNAGEDDSERAVACALDMQLAMENLNRKLENDGMPPLEMGIAVNTGEVVVGNVGSEKKAQFTVVGHHINVAFRIESFSKAGEILISDSTYQEVEKIVEIKQEKYVNAKGVSEPIKVYNLEGIKGDYNLSIQSPKNRS